MRLLIVTQYFPPESAVIQSVLVDELARRGHHVRVLTGYPNYPEGRIYPGYKQRWRGRERRGSVEVLRVPLYADHSQSAIKRMVNYASFALSTATARSWARGADVVYVYATQMTAAFGPWLWRLTGGAPYLLHVQDLWPDSITGSSLVEQGRSASIINDVLNPWLSEVYAKASAVVAIAPTMAETLVARGVDPAKVQVVYNWGDEADQAEAEDVPAWAASQTRVLYAGNVGDMQDLETAVHAAHRCQDAGVQLVIVGDGVALARITALAEELGATNVEFHGRVPVDEVGAFYRDTDFALISLKDLPVFRGTIPSKLQGALAQGVPVISSVPGDVRRLVQDLDAGFTADTESVDSLAAAFRAAAGCTAERRAELRAKAGEAYRSTFSQAAGVGALEAILADIAR